MQCNHDNYGEFTGWPVPSMDKTALYLFEMTFDNVSLPEPTLVHFFNITEILDMHLSIKKKKKS